jgi:hypothetical protein
VLTIKSASKVLFTILDLSEENAAIMGINNPQHHGEGIIYSLLADGWNFNWTGFV